MNTYTQELEFAKELALKAGTIITTKFRSTSRNTKSNFTPVTEADLAVSTLVVSEIKKRFPAHAVLDEELNPKQTESEYTWVCDPIDGTIPFSHHIPTSVFSLALCKHDKPVVGVVYDPYINRLLYATEGSKTFLNENETHVSTTRLSKGDTIFTIPYWIVDTDYQMLLSSFRAKNMTVSAVESVVYLCMLVATGAIPAAIMGSAHSWDRAAAKIIVENAGGKFTDEKGDELTVFGNHKNIVVSNGIVHDEILGVLKNCRRTSA